LIKDKKDYKKALTYIQREAPLFKKFQHMREFGQVLLQKEQKLTYEILTNLINLSTFRKHGQKDISAPNVSEKEVLKFLNIKEDEWKNIFHMYFPKPNEYFHLFVNNQD